MKAADVLAALRDGPMKPASHAWLYNVRERTGGMSGRYADALVVSLWPSRGIWLAGIEVKVDRGDWLRELKQPSKADAIGKFCKYWWIATTPDVVQHDELPETWGHYEVKSPTKVTVRKQPKVLKPQPMTLEFIASVFRIAAEQQEALRLDGFRAGMDKAAATYDTDAHEKLQEQLVQAQGERNRAERDKEYAERRLKIREDEIRVFCQQTGIDDFTNFGGSALANVGAHYQAALALSRRDPHLLAADFQRVADALRAVATTTTEPERAPTDEPMETTAT